MSESFAERMQRYHSWLKLGFFLVFVGVPAFAYLGAKQEGPKAFADRLRAIVVTGDVAEFRALSCHPVPCLHEGAIDYVFGGYDRGGGVLDRGGFVRAFLERPGIAVRVYGPLTPATEEGVAHYTIVYYDPAQVTFDEDGHLSPEQRESLWNKGYVETRVVSSRDGWAFFRTPFHYGAHLPFLGDYG